jgi:hypothetical protein
LQSQLSASVIELFDPVKAVSAVSHYLARLRYIAQLLGQLDQSKLGFDYLIACVYFGQYWG